MRTSSQPQTDKESASAQEKPLGVADRLALISLIDGAVRLEATESPAVADLFDDLSDLVDQTVKGSRIDLLKPEDSTLGFQVFQISGESGENLGRLHMLYFKKPIPCYYLVYVEVATPFRNLGLGNRIIGAFRDFATEKSAVALLDNIIPKEDPTFDIYEKLNWRPVEEITGGEIEGEGVFMIHVPSAMEGKDLKEPVRRLLYHLRRRRPAIDMRDNELMVRRTIQEFKDLYEALVTYFNEEIRAGRSTPVMRYMFTRFVTKFLGFRRRIARLIGYTGGESLEQIVLHPEVRGLPIHSYVPRGLASNPSFVSGDRELWLKLPEALKQEPARTIEALPNYRRPTLLSWLETRGFEATDPLTIGDMIDLGFDPTRLKEITLDGEEYIFERLQPRHLPAIERQKQLLELWAPELVGRRVTKAALKTNPPLLIIRDRGNGYILRRKIEGIHWEEAVEQLRTEPRLKGLNAALGIDRLVMAGVRGVREEVKSRVPAEEDSVADRFACFVSWDLAANQPLITVEMVGAYLESLWVA